MTVVPMRSQLPSIDLLDLGLILASCSSMVDAAWMI